MLPLSQIVVVTATVSAWALASYFIGSPVKRRVWNGHHRAIPWTTYLLFAVRVKWQSLLLHYSGVSSALSVLPDVEILAPDVIRIMGQNPSRMTLRGTNSYLIGTGPKRILIDPSDGNAKYMELLQHVCHAHGVEEITNVLLTHGHFDHIGGILAIKELYPNAKLWKYFPQDDRTLRVSNAESKVLGISSLDDGTIYLVPNNVDGGSNSGNMVLRAVYTPGHYNDHTCFFLESKEDDDSAAPHRRVLFSGDCVLGFGSCVFDSLKELMTSLQILYANKPQVIYPGHGPVVEDSLGKIKEYIKHRQQRENEVVGVLEAAAKEGNPPVALSSAEIVANIYDKLPFMLQLAARKAVEKHLHKLVLESRVERVTISGWFSSATTYRLID